MRLGRNVRDFSSRAFALGTFLPSRKSAVHSRLRNQKLLFLQDQFPVRRHSTRMKGLSEIAVIAVRLKDYKPPMALSRNAEPKR